MIQTFLRAAICGALALAMTSPAIAQTGSVSKSGPAEMPCLAFGLLLAVEAEDDEEAMQVGTLFTLYFYGRVRSAMSEAEVQRGLTAALDSFDRDPDSIDAHGSRCSAILDEAHKEMDRIGRAMQS